MDKMKKDYEKQISDIVNLKNQNETNLHIKEKEIVVMKLNNEKINSLHEQKFKFYEKEVSNWKEKCFAKKIMSEYTNFVFGSEAHGLTERRPNWDLLQRKVKPDKIEISNNILDRYIL